MNGHYPLNQPKVLNRNERMHILVEKLWTPGKRLGRIRTFSAEASDLTANKNWRPRNQCPGCDGFFSKDDIIQRLIQGTGEDAEVTGWVFACPHCKVFLTVYND